MGWIRAHRQWGGLAALFALTLQLVLSFGHLHVALAAPAPAVIALTQPAGDAPGHDDDHAGKPCDICAVVHALSTAQAAAPPVLAVPVAFTVARHAPADDRAAAPTFRTAFRSRAPPAA